MTWSAFLQAMRTGIQSRVGGAAQRGARRAPQQHTMSVSTQANQITNHPEMGLEQVFWDNLVLDEYGEPAVLTTCQRPTTDQVAVRSSSQVETNRPWENMMLDEYGEPSVLMLIPPL